MHTIAQSKPIGLAVVLAHQDVALEHARHHRAGVVLVRELRELDLERQRVLALAQRDAVRTCSELTNVDTT